MKTVPFREVREFYQRQCPEGHWFDTNTLRFFRTKLPEAAYETDTGLMFVTGETDPSGREAFTVRRQRVSGKIQTVGGFHAHTTAAAARKAIKQYHVSGVPA